MSNAVPESLKQFDTYFSTQVKSIDYLKEFSSYEYKDYCALLYTAVESRIGLVKDLETAALDVFNARKDLETARQNAANSTHPENAAAHAQAVRDAEDRVSNAEKKYRLLEDQLVIAEAELVYMTNQVESYHQQLTSKLADIKSRVDEIEIPKTGSEIQLTSEELEEYKSIYQGYNDRIKAFTEKILTNIERGNSNIEEAININKNMPSMIPDINYNNKSTKSFGLSSFPPESIKDMKVGSETYENTKNVLGNIESQKNEYGNYISEIEVTYEEEEESGINEIEELPDENLEIDIEEEGETNDIDPNTNIDVEDSEDVTGQDNSVTGIDFSKIAGTAAGAKSGDFIETNQVHDEYFDMDRMYAEERDDGTVLLYEIDENGNKTPMGFTTKDAITTNNSGSDMNMNTKNDNSAVTGRESDQSQSGSGSIKYETPEQQAEITEQEEKAMEQQENAMRQQENSIRDQAEALREADESMGSGQSQNGPGPIRYKTEEKENPYPNTNAQMEKDRTKVYPDEILE